MASPYEALRFESPAGAPLARPLRDAFHLPAREALVAEARRLVHERLRQWQVTEDSRADAQLLVSELFTNAVRHTDSEKVSCELWLIGVRLRLEVRDEGCAVGGPLPDDATSPDALTPEADAEGGRGLLLVSVLADDWGVRSGDSSPDEAGHAVWVELPCTRTLP